MKPRFHDLFKWEGTISRGVFLFWGFAFAALKYNLDRFILVAGFGHIKHETQKGQA
jgi:hypothetical protein